MIARGDSFMPGASFPSFQRRRLRRLLVIIGLLALPLLPVAVWNPAYAQANVSTPGPGWVGARLNIPRPCRDNGTVGVCDTTTQSATGLYEYKPMRRKVGEFWGESPPEMDPHFHGHTRAAQGRCIVGGVPKQWPAGYWHYGGRWTRTISYSGGTPQVSWTSGTLAYSFAKEDMCTNPTPTPERTPTGTPPGGGTPPPGTPGTDTTPTRPIEEEEPTETTNHRRSNCTPEQISMPFTEARRSAPTGEYARYGASGVYATTAAAAPVHTRCPVADCAGRSYPAFRRRYAPASARPRR